MAMLKELLRRRVPQVLAIYVGASWGIVEFVDFFAQRFALSPHLIDLALFVPLLFLPSVVLITYFHGAPGQDQWVTAEKVGIPVNLILALVFLWVFFHGKELGATTTTVMVTDEEGVESERVVPKEEFRRRLAVFFFEAEPADTAAVWVQYGLSVAVAKDLVQDHFLDPQTPFLFPDRLRESGFERFTGVPLSLARELSEDLHRDHFVMGSVRVEGAEIQATVSLYDSRRGRLIREETYTGDDVMALADQISVQIRTDLETPDLGEEGSHDLPVAEMLTNSPAAYRLSIESGIASEVERDFDLATTLMEEAVAEDPTYADAQASLVNLYLFQNRAGEIAGPMQAAMENIYRLPERERFVVKSNYYFLIRQDMEKAIASLDMWAELFPDDLRAYEARLQIQVMRDDKDGALASLNKILELDPNRREVLLQIGAFQEGKGDFPAAEEAFLEYAQEFPEDHEVLAKLADLVRKSGKLEEARDYYDRALLLAPMDVGLLVGQGAVRQVMGDFEGAQEQFDEAMAVAGTPEGRAQVYAALEAYYLARGQVGKAIEQMETRLEEASAFQTTLVVAQLRIAEAGTYARAGRVEEAFALVEEARAQLPPPFPDLADFGLLQIHKELENADEIEALLPGLEAFIESLQYEILRPAILGARGEVHALRGEYREALSFFEEQRRLAPDGPSVVLNLGRCHRELGEFDVALSHLEEAQRISPFGGRANLELALTYEEKGRVDEARSHIARAMEVWAPADPEYKWARRAAEVAERLGG